MCRQAVPRQLGWMFVCGIVLDFVVAGPVPAAPNASYASLQGLCVALAVVPPIPPPPPHNWRKHRYISIDPRGAGGENFGQNFDIRVKLTATLVPGAPTGGIWWANAPDADCIAFIGPTRPASPPNWDACPVLHVGGCPIIPTSTYEIVAVDGVSESAPPLVAETQELPTNNPGKKWGDIVGDFDSVADQWVGPDHFANTKDIYAAILTFQEPTRIGPGCGTPPCNAVHVSVGDVHPVGFPGHPWGTPNKQVDTNDLFAIILGFQGNDYPGWALEMCPDP